MNARILVIEDSPTQAAQLCFLLEEAGYAVTTAPDGARALELLSQINVDLVISDITMPGVDGYEVCRRIKLDQRQALPVILLTNLTDPMDIIRGLEVGADNYVTKPYEPDQLLLRVRHVLENQRMRRVSKSALGVTVSFLNRTFTITSDREQILDLLISTFEDAVLQNRRLRQREEELQRAKAQLARYAGTLENRLSQVLHSVPEVLFSFNPPVTELYYASPASAAVFGVTPEQLAAEPARWQTVIHPDDRPRVLGQYARLVRDGRRGVVEYRVVGADGTARWVETTFVPVADADGRAVRVDGIASDITERRLLEQQLQHAQKMEAVGTLAGGVAHDFNNVLAAIRATADLAALAVPEGSDAATELEQIQTAVDHGATLTRQLLTLGRGQVMDPRPLDLRTLIERIQKMLARVISSPVRLVIQTETEPLRVIADPGQLEQVLLNLCINARDAMPDGGELSVVAERVTLDAGFCQLHPWAEEGDYALLMVSDTGTGMPPDVQARIFEPFFTTKEVGKGTGLGLAVVYGIVKQHGGMIHVYSEPGKGTIFRIYLPSNIDEVAATAATAPAVLPPRGAGVILLAEDDPVLRSMTARLLAHLGYDPLVAADGREALTTLVAQGERIQLAILDVMMPELGGPEVAERVRDHWPHIRYLFTTGYASSSLHLAQLRDQSLPVLQKPYGMTTLAHTVSQLLAPAPPAST